MIRPPVASHPPLQRKFTQEVKKAFSESWRGTLRDYCQLSTLHGVRDCYHAKNVFLRLFWVLSLASGLASAFYGCAAIISQYNTMPYATIYYIQDPSGSPRYLPDIVVCPFNRFNRSFLIEHSIDNDMIEYVQVAFGMGTPYKFQRELSKKFLKEKFPEYAPKLDEQLRNLSMTFGEFIEKASFSCNSIVRYCVLPKYGKVDCCADAEPMLMPVGMCYRIKGNEQIHSGLGFGITLVLKVPDDEFLSPGMNNLHNDGMAIKLAESGKGLDFDLTFIPSGAHALAPLRATRFEFTNDPPRYECLENALANYSTTMCFDQCFFSTAVSACKCRHMATQDLRYPPCKPREISGCLRDEMKKVFNGSATLFLDCRKKCKAPCIYWQYIPIVSYTRFPSEALFRYVSEDERTHWKKFIVLDLFYETLEYSVVKHVPTMTPDTFVSNIGGQLGLWVGGSVLTVVQLILFLWKNVWAQFERAWTRSRSVYARLIQSANIFVQFAKPEENKNGSKQSDGNELRHTPSMAHKHNNGVANHKSRVEGVDENYNISQRCRCRAESADACSTSSSRSCSIDGEESEDPRTI